MFVCHRRNAPPPAPEDVIEALPKRKLTDDEIGKAPLQLADRFRATDKSFFLARQTDCAVCKDEFSQEEQVTQLPCAHIFHEDCIKPWLKMNGTCPVW